MSERWDLSAPASQVLLTGAATPADWALQLAFKELVLRQRLTLRRERRRKYLVLRRKVDILALGPRPTLETDWSLEGVMDAFPRARFFRTFQRGVPKFRVAGQGGVPIDVAAAAVKSRNRVQGGYVQAEVLPELQRRGLYHIAETERGLEWALTGEGTQKLVELRALLDTGRSEFAGWLRDAPEKAAAYLTAAGAALLLLGNPVAWLWHLLAEVLARRTVAAEDIPSGAGPPFVLLPAQQQSQRAAGRESAGAVVATPLFIAGESGDAPDERSAEAGSSPGEKIDDGVCRASDSAADDSDGDGE